MFIVFILAFARGWVVGNKAGKEEAKEFMPGDRVWFYDKERNDIDQGLLIEVQILTCSTSWVIETIAGEFEEIGCKCHLFKDYDDAEQFLHYKNGGK